VLQVLVYLGSDRHAEAMEPLEAWPNERGSLLKRGLPVKKRRLSGFFQQPSKNGWLLISTALMYPLKLYLSTPDESAGEALLDEAARWVADRMGDHLFSKEGRSMADEVGRLLMARQATLAVAESCTGGLIGNWLTNSPGSSSYFNLSAVTYHNQAKIDMLGVGEQTLIDHGAVSEETALEMAQGARRAGRSTFGVATTGFLRR
jgi:hypothetical protein